MRRLTTRILIDNPDYDARVGLIRATLAQYYNFSAYVDSLPGDMRADERADTLERRALHNIRRYGSCVTVTKGRVFATDVVEPQYVTAKDISDLALKMGPTKSAEADMKHRREPTSRGGFPEFSSQAQYRYGFSGADAVVVVGDAIREAASRAIATGARYVWIDVPTAAAAAAAGSKRTTATAKKEAVARYAVYVPGTGRCPLSTSRRGEGKEAKTASEEDELLDEDAEDVEEAGGTIGIDQVPQKKDIVSFDLRVSDLSWALEKYGRPPTKEKDYLAYVAQPSS